MGIEIFAKHLREKRAVKIDTGYNNYDLDLIAKIARSAQNAKASAIDIPASKEVYDTVRKNSRLPIFISSIQPFEILNAVKWGADAVEIGSWEQTYKNGIRLKGDELYNLVLECIALINNYNVFVSVSIPGNLEIAEQVRLIKKLELLGVNLIQVEGTRPIELRKIVFAKDTEAAIKNTFELNKFTKIPVVTSALMSYQNIETAFMSGASGIAFDESILKLDTEVAMTNEIRKIVGSISHRNSLNREIVRSQIELAFN